jgi:hypothetical protein
MQQPPPSLSGGFEFGGEVVVLMAQLLEASSVKTPWMPEFAEWSAAYKSLRGES